MRLRTGHKPEDWSDNIPAEPLPAKGFAGSLVKGAPGPVEMGRIQSNASRKAARERKEAVTS